MSKSARHANPIILRKGMTVGSANAESDDEFLFQCFVSHSAVNECTRVQSPGMIVSGRTGSGKTAILRHVKVSHSDSSVEIDPSEMSMNYVSNSDSLRFVEAIGGDIDLLFQVLWKHILCLEFIRLRWQITNTEKSKNWYYRIVRNFSLDERKKKAVEYLRQWEGNFWITVDQNIKEITEKVENKLSFELGTELNKFKAGGQYDKRLSLDKKSELIRRSSKIINSEQLSELHSVIDLLARESSGDNGQYYILIDGLDERWVDSSLRFRMIRSLIESLKTFRKITNLKILVALRSDVLERVVQETKDLSFQREKFEDYFVRIHWSRSELKAMINKRVGALFRRQYSDSNICFDDLFPYKMHNQDAFDYIIERTLMRPRDVISFVNECISASEGNTEVSVSHMRQATVEFSRKRLDALEQEWLSAFPTLRKILEFFALKKAASVTFSKLLEGEGLAELALSIATEGKIQFDPIYGPSVLYAEGGQKEQFSFLQQIVATAYRTGAIGVKLESNERFIYSHIDEPLISPARLNQDTRIRIHPMLHGAFRLSQEGENRR